MSEATHYQPKGSMCIACAHGNEDCSHLEFKTMPVMMRLPIDGRIVAIVRCTSFEAKEVRNARA